MIDRKPPIVAIDIREIVGHRTGKANVVYRLITEWANKRPTWQPLLYANANFQPTESNFPSWMKTRIIQGGRGRRFLWLARDIESQGANLALHPTGYHVALVGATPTILIVYDLVAFGPFAHSLPWKTRLAERLMLPRAAKKAVHILAISEFTKKELIQYLDLPESKITVMPLAAGNEFRPATAVDQKTWPAIRDRYQLPADFLLFVGTLEPRKNIAGLLNAYHALSKELKDRYPLLLVGRSGWLAEPIETMINKLGEEETIRHIGSVTPAELPAFYQQATAFVYPSFYEGFGMPPLEAMASGCPVITSNVASLPEVVGQAALQIDPNKSDELTAALAKFLTDTKLQQELRAAGLQQAEKFSWKQSAEIADRVITKSLSPFISS